MDEDIKRALLHLTARLTVLETATAFLAGQHGAFAETLEFHMRDVAENHLMDTASDAISDEAVLRREQNLAAVRLADRIGREIGRLKAGGSIDG